MGGAVTVLSPGVAGTSIRLVPSAPLFFCSGEDSVQGRSSVEIIFLPGYDVIKARSEEP